jgi:hypothetical protein
MAIHRNRLANEASPYLLQHASNPVEWFPWSEEAFARARDLDRPVFLSIGYAACHWCHVMERESFEDEGTASFLNERFVSIKVDREERPDVDGIYMDAAQAMTGQGGWPLSAFLTPDGKPFYVGTYFPDRPRHGMPSFRQVLEGIAEAWTERRDEIVTQGGRVTDAIARAGALDPSPEPPDDATPAAALERLRSAFDPVWGGFGGAPKFPQPMVLTFLLRTAVRGSLGAAEMVTTTLDRLTAGGIADQVGGGFARYSTDAFWHVPHFEKMLYDNAQLALLFTRAWQVLGHDRFRTTAERTLGYLLREMQHPEGGFWSSQDADSEGVEGRFSVWAWNELVGHVGEPVARAFGASPEGNWEGTNVLWHPRSIAEVARQSGLRTDELAEEVEDARAVLFGVRESRPHPATDDKVLASWNGMAIDALARAGRAFGDEALLDAAIRAATFVLTHLRDDDGRLLRSWRDGVTGTAGFADDHASMARACLALFESTGDLRWFDEAESLGEALVRLFADRERGGFFQTGTDTSGLVVRPKDLYDNATPSGNSMGADVCLRLGMLTGDATMTEAGVSALRLVRDAMAAAPTGFGEALSVLDLLLGPAFEVAVVGEPGSPSTRALTDEVLASTWRPRVVLAQGDPSDPASERVPLLRERAAVDGLPTAYVCQGFSCRLPVTAPEAVAELLVETP